MEIAYWIVAGLLAAFYLYGGGLKLVRTQDELRPMMAWVDRMPMAAVRAIGAVEVLGAVGLVLPPATGVAPWLALAAAVGFAVLQVGALRTHLAMGDRQVAMNVVLVVAALVVAWLSTTWL